MSRLFRIKPIDDILHDSQDNGEGRSLQRVLTLPGLLGLGVGTIMGAGVFVMTGSVAAECAGPSLVLSFIIAAIACTFTALCYSEFASSIPVAGSAYTYGYATLGEIVAFIIALGVTLEYALGASAVAAGWSGYFYSFLQEVCGPISPRFFDIPGATYVLWNDVWINTHSFVDCDIDLNSLPHVVCCGNWVGMLLIVLVSWVLIRGIELSTKVNTVLVLLKLSLVAVFVGVIGFFIMGHFDLAMSNWTPFIPANTGEYGKFGWSGIAKGAAMLFFAYVGFDCVSTAAQEAKNPRRDVPIATVGSLAICTIIYIVVCLLMTGIVSFKDLNVADPASRAIDVTGVSWCIMFINGGLSISLMSGVLALMMSLSRVLFGISTDGLLPAIFSKVHPAYNTPWVATVAVTLPVALFTTLLPIGELGELVSLGALLAFTIVCCGVLILRRKYPHKESDFITPGGPTIPILGALISGALMLSLSGLAWMRFLVFLGAGMLVYFTYSIKHSKLNGSNNENK